MTDKPAHGVVLMDLDGTISDPRVGLLAAFRHGLEQVGHTLPSDEPLDWVIGPPLLQSFATVLGGDKARAVAALDHYRKHYGGGAMYQNTLYPGMREAIAALGAGDRRLYLATSKLDRFAAMILRNFGLADAFAGVYGSDLAATRGDKAAVIAHCLESERLDPRACVMIGDREHDVHGAAAHGIPCIGVAWGYGGIEELTGAGARAICNSPADLPRLVAEVLHARQSAAPA
jgi:phosphoglycolate phosphatase